MTDTRFLPFDIETMSRPEFGSGGDEPGWITAYPSYHFISYDMVSAVCDAATSFHDRPDARIVIGAMLPDIFVDLRRIARITLDLQGILESGATPCFNPEYSRILRFLTDSTLEPSHFFDAYWRVPGAGTFQRVTRELYRHGRSWLGLAQRKPLHDLLSVNDLLDEYVKNRGCGWVAMGPPRRSLTPPDATSLLVEEVTDTLFAAYRRALPPELVDGSVVARRAGLAARSCIARHSAEAERDLRQLRRALPWRAMGPVLVSGTPKYFGRLLGALYAETGRRVIRFAHGGERGLYADLHWPVSELTFCDEYYFHGRTEADLIAARAANGGMVWPYATETRFVSLGSRKHQAILRRAEQRPAGPRSGKVMYVPGSYLGEIHAHFPAMCPPDPITYEWQCWLLPRIKNLGYDVSVKVHPKGVNKGGSLLAGHCSETVGGRFDPNAHDADCFVFDFAGTAFMDALASGVGIVLLDHGIRPLDPQGTVLLDARVNRVPCHFDERNRLRVDMDLLATAIETAAQNRPLEQAADFVNGYYAA